MPVSAANSFTPTGSLGSVLAKQSPRSKNRAERYEEFVRLGSLNAGRSTFAAGRPTVSVVFALFPAQAECRGPPTRSTIIATRYLADQASLVNTESRGMAG